MNSDICLTRRGDDNKNPEPASGTKPKLRDFVTFTLMRHAVTLGLLLHGTFSYAQPQSWQLQDLLDPFWVGFRSQFSYALNSAPSSSRHSLAVAFSRGWVSGTALEVEAPFVLQESGAAIPGAKAPRLGSGRSNRIQIRGLFRIVGNSQSYVSMEMGTGLPFQTDAAFINSIYGSWNFQAGARFQWMTGRWAWLGGVSVTNFLPTEIPTVGDSKIILSPAGEFSFSLRTTCSLTPRINVYVQGTETLPVVVEVGSYSSLAAFTFLKTSLNRNRRLAIGTDLQWGQKTGTLTLEGAYVLESQSGPSNAIELGSKLAWNW